MAVRVASAPMCWQSWNFILNKTLKTGRHPILALAIPVERDQLISGVVEGLGDVAIGNLTVTPPSVKVKSISYPAWPLPE